MQMFKRYACIVSSRNTVQYRPEPCITCEELLEKNSLEGMAQDELLGKNGLGKIVEKSECRLFGYAFSR